MTRNEVEYFLSMAESEFNFELGVQLVPSSPLDLAYPYVFGVMEQEDTDDDYVKEVLKTLSIQSGLLGFPGREYELISKNGMYILHEPGPEVSGTPYWMEGVNRYIGRFACHSHQNQFRIESTKATLSEAEFDLSGLGLYFEGIHAISGHDAKEIEDKRIKERAEGSYFVPIKDVSNLRSRSLEV